MVGVLSILLYAGPFVLMTVVHYLALEFKSFRTEKGHFHIITFGVLNVIMGGGAEPGFRVDPCVLEFGITFRPLTDHPGGLAPNGTKKVPGRTTRTFDGPEVKESLSMTPSR